MTKHDGTYYLQYAISGTEYNIYGDGVYISKSPLGPFIPAKNNPYSYKPDGFITGAGHGSTRTGISGIQLPCESVITTVLSAGWGFGMMVRYLRLTILELPYREVPCVSGIRVFGLGEGETPEKAKEVTCIRRGKFDMEVSWEAEMILNSFVHVRKGRKI